MIKDYAIKRSFLLLEWRRVWMTGYLIFLLLIFDNQNHHIFVPQSSLKRNSYFQGKSSTWPWLTPAKFGCRTPSSETRRLEDFTPSSLPTSMSESFPMETFYTVSGENQALLVNTPHFWWRWKENYFLRGPIYVLYYPVHFGMTLILNLRKLILMLLPLNDDRKARHLENKNVYYFVSEYHWYAPVACILRCFHLMSRHVTWMLRAVSIIIVINDIMRPGVTALLLYYSWQPSFLVYWILTGVRYIHWIMQSLIIIHFNIWLLSLMPICLQMYNKMK